MSQSISKRTKHTRVKLRVDDEVVVIAGKEKGKRGKIMALNRKRNILVVQGINLRPQFQRPTQENPKGGSLEIERPLHLSNVAYYETKTKKAKRLAYIVKAPKEKLRALRDKGKLDELKESAKTSP